MRARAWIVSGSLVVALAGAGCGGGGNSAPPNCLQVQPCGGNVVGTWTLLGACYSDKFRAQANANLATACPGASIDTFDLDVSGTITFNADLTYTFNVHETVSATERIPLSCLSFASCAEVTSSSPESTLTCTGTTTCNCRASGSPTGDETGTYTTSGTSLATTAADLTSNTDAYCVEQNRLHIIGVDDATGNLLGDFVAQKQ